MRSTGNDYWSQSRKPDLPASRSTVSASKGDFGLSALELLRFQLHRKRQEQKAAAVEQTAQASSRTNRQQFSTRESARGLNKNSHRSLSGSQSMPEGDLASGRIYSQRSSQRTQRSQRSSRREADENLTTSRLKELEQQAKLLEEQLAQINDQLSV